MSKSIVTIKDAPLGDGRPKGLHRLALGERYVVIGGRAVPLDAVADPKRKIGEQVAIYVGDVRYLHDVHTREIDA